MRSIEGTPRSTNGVWSSRIVPWSPRGNTAPTPARRAARRSRPHRRPSDEPSRLSRGRADPRSRAGPSPSLLAVDGRRRLAAAQATGLELAVGYAAGGLLAVEEHEAHRRAHPVALESPGQLHRHGGAGGAVVGPHEAPLVLRVVVGAHDHQSPGVAAAHLAHHVAQPSGYRLVAPAGQRPAQAPGQSARLRGPRGTRSQPDLAPDAPVRRPPAEVPRPMNAARTRRRRTRRRTGRCRWPRAPRAGRRGPPGPPAGCRGRAFSARPRARRPAWAWPRGCASGQSPACRSGRPRAAA